MPTQARGLVVLLAMGVVVLSGAIVWRSMPVEPSDPHVDVYASATSGASRLVLGLGLDINQSTADELALLPGVGLKTARAIVAYRQTHGPFARVEKLDAVHGIGAKTVRRLAPYLTVGATGDVTQQMRSIHP